MQPRNVSLTWQRKQKRCRETWSKFKMLSFPSPVLNEILENLCKINRHLKDPSLIWGTGLQETARNRLPMLTHTGFPRLGFDWVWRVRFSPSVHFQQHHSELCDSDKGYNYTHFEMHFTNILCAGATGIKHRQSPGVPNFFSFHTSPFQITTSRITRNSRKFLALDVPMIPSWHAKKTLIFPLKIMYFPGTVQGPPMRRMKDLFWPTYEKTFPLSTRAPRLSYNIPKISVSKENSFP